MKMLNFDARTLILQNLRVKEHEEPSSYTRRQYQILYNLIKQKHIKKAFFDFILFELYGLSNWRELTYQQMYELIFILNHYDYNRERN